MITSFLVAVAFILLFHFLASHTSHKSIAGIEVYVFPSFIKWFLSLGVVFFVGIFIYGINSSHTTDVRIHVPVIFVYIVYLAITACIIVGWLYALLVRLILTDHAIYRERWRPVRWYFTDIQKILLSRQNAYIVGPQGKKIYVSMMMADAADLVRKLHERCPNVPVVDRITGKPIEHL